MAEQAEEITPNTAAFLAAAIGAGISVAYAISNRAWGWATFCLIIVIATLLDEFAKAYRARTRVLART